MSFIRRRLILEVGSVTRRALGALAVALVLVGCRGADAAVIGTFPGDWTLYRAIFITLPDGGNGDQIAHKETPNGPDKGAGEITIAKSGAGYQVAYKAPFTTCRLTAQWEGERLVVDQKQTCVLEVPGFKGEADVEGTLKSPADGALSASLRFTPRGAKPPSSANADFVGNRNRAR